MYTRKPSVDVLMKAVREKAREVLKTNNKMCSGRLGFWVECVIPNNKIGVGRGGAGHNTQFADYRAAGRFRRKKGGWCGEREYWLLWRGGDREMGKGDRREGGRREERARREREMEEEEERKGEKEREEREKGRGEGDERREIRERGRREVKRGEKRGKGGRKNAISMLLRASGISIPMSQAL
jgi:hypothetical protein